VSISDRGIGLKQDGTAKCQKKTTQQLRNNNMIRKCSQIISYGTKGDI
jgi:hypothetical protein